MSLETYRKKRNFNVTPEPSGDADTTEGNSAGFVVQEHHATRLHFDFRIEKDGVLKSWAVPKGPSLNPRDKRLAMMTEDHPIEYLEFEGSIPEGNYGAGDMAIWDRGTYEALEDRMEEGKLVLRLQGQKLKGEFHMVRLKDSEKEWLMMKGKDEFADPNFKLEQILEGGSRKDRKKITSGKSPEARGNDPYPEAVQPMLATLVDKAFDDPEWLFEVKWDGYRALVYIRDGKLFKLISRNDLDLLARFPAFSDIASEVKATDAILDAEIVALDDEGRPDFQMLQNATELTRWSKPRKNRTQQQPAAIVMYVFDMMYLDGEDLRKKPLTYRKSLLKEAVKGSEMLRYSDHVEETGIKLFEIAEESGLEGIIGKRSSSYYTAKRSRDWVKIKTTKRQEFLITGYTAPKGSRKYFGALVLGTWQDGKLVFNGHVGGGFNQKSLKQVFETLQPLTMESSPFEIPPQTNGECTWLRPELLAEVKFSEMTSDGILRHPVFMGLRDDKDAESVVQEKPEKAIEAREPVWELVDAPVTSPNKLYWTREGITKGDLITYYYDMRDFVLPYLKDRQLILKRYPNGVSGQSFYQHNLEDAPGFIKQHIEKDSDGDEVHYAIANDIRSLLYLVNLGTIGQNPFSNRYDMPDRPDWLVFDLDPNDADFASVCKAAIVLKAILDDIGLQSYPKTSGSSGIHLYVPIKAEYSFKQAYDAAALIARTAAKADSKLITVERLIKKRGKGRIYVDYMQNNTGKSVVSPYSVRACPDATVSTPLSWEEVESCPAISDFTIRNVPDRVKALGDLFRPVLDDKQDLGDAISRLEKQGV